MGLRLRNGWRLYAPALWFGPLRRRLKAPPEAFRKTRRAAKIYSELAGFIPAFHTLNPETTGPVLYLYLLLPPWYTYVYSTTRLLVPYVVEGVARAEGSAGWGASAVSYM